MFCTGGGGWVSEDLVNWRYQGVEMRQGRVPVAPHVVKYNGQFYMSGNNAPLYRAPAILGPYEVAGQLDGRLGQAVRWGLQRTALERGVRRRHLRGRRQQAVPVLPGRSTDGIYVVPLDPRDLSRFAAAPTRLFGFDRSHTWERYGDMNEYPDVSWIEGPWMMKHRGHLLPAVQRLRDAVADYAAGVYTSKRPTGPFAYSPVNPILRKTSGVVTGTSHGSHRPGPRRQLVAVLHHRAGEPARRAAGRHGSGRLRRSAATSSCAGRARRRSGGPVPWRIPPGTAIRARCR